MPDRHSYSYPRYLNAKRPVDERALNHGVWSTFVENLAESGGRCRILEVGGGVGATFQRVATALENQPVDTLHYTLVDRNGENLSAARSNVAKWANDRGYDVETAIDSIILGRDSYSVELELHHDDLFEYAQRDGTEGFDAIIAQAVIDLLDLEDFFRALRPHLRRGGLWYLPIHFDGLTSFEPPTAPDIDGQIIRLYHESMSGSEEQEGSRATTGRQLLSWIQASEDALLAAGSSDWVVFPRQDGYPNDEAYFLSHMLHFIEEELCTHPDLDEETLSQWLETRRRQIAENELIFIAHQLDVLAESA